MQMLIQEPTQATIKFALANYAYSDAIFLCERLHAQVPSADSLLLLAQSYYLSGKPNVAFHLLKNAPKSIALSPQCRYLLGRCCYTLRQYAQALEVLLKPFITDPFELDHRITRQQLIDCYDTSAAFVAQLLGKIFHHSDCAKHRDPAVYYYRLSLSINPLLWSSFECLTQLEPDAADPEKLFSIENFQFEYVAGLDPLASLFQLNNAQLVADTERDSISGGEGSKFSNQLQSATKSVHHHPLHAQLVTKTPQTSSPLKALQNQNPIYEEHGENAENVFPTHGTNRIVINTPYAVLKQSAGRLALMTPKNNGRWSTEACFAPCKQTLPSPLPLPSSSTTGDQHHTHNLHHNRNAKDNAKDTLSPTWHKLVTRGTKASFVSLNSSESGTNTSIMVTPMDTTTTGGGGGSSNVTRLVSNVNPSTTGTGVSNLHTTKVGGQTMRSNKTGGGRSRKQHGQPSLAKSSSASSRFSLLPAATTSTTASSTATAAITTITTPITQQQQQQQQYSFGVIKIDEDSFTVLTTTSSDETPVVTTNTGTTLVHNSNAPNKNYVREQQMLNVAETTTTGITTTRARVAKRPHTRRNIQLEMMQDSMDSSSSTNSTSSLTGGGVGNSINATTAGGGGGGGTTTTSSSSSNVLRRSTRLYTTANNVKENNNTSVGVATTPRNGRKISGAPIKRFRRTGGGGGTSSSTNNSSANNNSSSSSSLQQQQSQSITTLPDNIQENHYKGETEEKLKVITSVDVSKAAKHTQHIAASSLLKLLAKFGIAHKLLATFRCKEAIAEFRQLPSAHYQTGFVLSSVGRAYFEMGKYDKSIEVFQQSRQLEPYRLQGVEVYSTALWHRQKEVELACLAHNLQHFDQAAPETWCVIGNLFSLQKEHELSIKFLKRAIQRDQDFFYAHTLLGHEFVAADECDQAMGCFQNAARINDRHYNAWYGMGMIYYKQEQYDLAHEHYRRALSISPSNPILLCHLAIVTHQLKRTNDALELLNEATKIDPENVLVKFHRASINFASEHYDEAMQELEELKQIVPNESMVYFLMGKIFKVKGDTHSALMNFSWAMDLDPKGASTQVKELIDRHYSSEDDIVIHNNAATDAASAAAAHNGLLNATNGSMSTASTDTSTTNDGSGDGGSSITINVGGGDNLISATTTTTTPAAAAAATTPMANNGHRAASPFRRAIAAMVSTSTSPVSFIDSPTTSSIGNNSSSIISHNESSLRSFFVSNLLDITHQHQSKQQQHTHDDDDEEEEEEENNDDDGDEVEVEEDGDGGGGDNEDGDDNDDNDGVGSVVRYNGNVDEFVYSDEEEEEEEEENPEDNDDDEDDDDDEDEDDAMMLV